MKIRRCTHHPCGPKTYVGPLDTSSRDSVELVVVVVVVVVLIKARKGKISIPFHVVDVKGRQISGSYFV